MNTQKLLTEREILEFLSRKIGVEKIKEIGEWASQSYINKNFLWNNSFSKDKKISVNSLWVISRLEKSERKWLYEIQPQVISLLLHEENVSKKRILLQILRTQKFNPDDQLTIRLLEWCLSKINSECEPYAIRCFSIYIAFEISKEYPELLTELENHLSLLTFQSLSPGLKSAMKITKQNILKIKNKKYNNL